MQAGDALSVSGMVDAIGERLEGKLKIAEFDGKVEPLEQSGELDGQLGSDHEEVGDDEEEDGEFEFSFHCGSPKGSPIAAEEAFLDGQIRSSFPLFDQSLLYDDSDEPATPKHLRKLFAEGSAAVSTSASGEPEADYSPWVGRTVEEIKSLQPAALGQKSNSTGSSRLWRFRDFIHRSSSDGKDAFVFLNPAAAAPGGDGERKKQAAKAGVRSLEKAPAAKAVGKGKKAAAAAAGPPPPYGRSKGPEKRRSYLPYRPGLVGFFTSVNGLSKNVHPF